MTDFIPKVEVENGRMKNRLARLEESYVLYKKQNQVRLGQALSRLKDRLDNACVRVVKEKAYEDFHKEMIKIYNSL